MSLAAGTRLGPYEIQSLLGSGGMGEVYRARDTRLGRAVAVKVLPEDASRDEGRLRRFEAEARAVSALNHPNLLIVFDVGAHEGKSYLVSELLEGDTLRSVLLAGPPPWRAVLDYAAQIARGLAAAHDQNLVHRDLKPENLFVTRDGRVKILDFGLAKLRPTLDPTGRDSRIETASAVTGPGAVVGTVGYMSPEQVYGQPVDPRSDLFSFGAVLYEMLTGRRAFRRDSVVETMNAILKEEPPEVESADQRPLPPALERIVRRCLEKTPERRFRSAHDLAFALETQSGSSGVGVPAPSRGRPRLLGLAAGVTLLALGSLLGHWYSGPKGRDQPAYERLTFQRGLVRNARFTHDGQSVFYSAAWGDEPFRIFSTRLGGVDSQRLDLAPAALLAVSATEMAIALGAPRSYPNESFGTLAVAPLTGGAPREILEGVNGADFSRDGKTLAVTRRVGERFREKFRLEYPLGTVLYESDSLLYSPRVAPSGDALAFGEHAGRLVMVDLKGHQTLLSTRFEADLIDLAWNAATGEVWYFSGGETRYDYAIRAVDRHGHRREVATFPELAHLSDIARDGRALVVTGERREGLVARAPGATREREIPTHGQEIAFALSADGRLVLSGSTDRSGQWASYVAKTDGSAPPVRIAFGRPENLSYDGRWAIVFRSGPPAQRVLVPIGPGEERVLDSGGIEPVRGSGFLPGDRRIVVTGRRPGEGYRSYLMDLPDGKPQFWLGDEYNWIDFSPDGKSLLLVSRDGTVRVGPIDGASSRALPGGPEPVGSTAWWGLDARSIFVMHDHDTSATVFRQDSVTGKREPWKEIAPVDPAGVLFFGVVLCGDGQSYAYTYERRLGTVQLVTGLR